MEVKKILVTGCAGFIGSHFTNMIAFTNPEIKVVALTRNTDQKNLKRLDQILNYPEASPNFKLVYEDIASPSNLTELLEEVDVVVNFAAKTFVDYSVRDPRPFIESNIIGTYNLLEAVRMHPVKMFIQISTDEVYGACKGEPHHEESMLNPTNPYSSTKAAADVLCMGYAKTFGIPILITRTENNFGSFQHPQKVMPTWVKKAMADEKLPIYGDGKHKRMWLPVEEHCEALWFLIRNDARGIYHIAGSHEIENIDLAKMILRTLGKPEDQIEFIDDSKIRPNHDRRYAMSTEKIESLGWAPRYDVEGMIENAVSWFQANDWWFV